MTRSRRALPFVWMMTLAVSLACGKDRGAETETAAGDRDLELAITRDTPAVALADRPAPVTPPPSTAAPEPRRSAPKPAPKPTPEPAPKPAPPPEPVTATVPVGSTFDVIMDDTLSTKTSKVGDSFTAKLAAEIRSPDGKVLVPAGAEFRGEVTAVESSGGAGEEAVIGVSFRTLSFAGRTYPVRARVTAAEVESTRTTGDAEQAAKILGGAAAGAILGKVIGKDAKSTIIGAAAGAAAGTAVALGTADHAGVIPKGGKVTLKLDDPIEVVVG